MDSTTEEETLTELYGEDYVDVTDGVTCYEKGKTFECECGQGFGTDFGKFSVKCPSCLRMVIDRDADEREPPQREEGQTGLSEWT